MTITYHVELVAKPYYSKEELHQELRCRMDGHSTLAVTRLLAGAESIKPGAAQGLMSSASRQVAETVSLTRYMAFADFLCQNVPSLVLAYRPRDPYNEASYRTGSMASIYVAAVGMSMSLRGILHRR